MFVFAFVFSGLTEAKSLEFNCGEPGKNGLAQAQVSLKESELEITNGFGGDYAVEAIQILSVKVKTEYDSRYYPGKTVRLQEANLETYDLSEFTRFQRDKWNYHAGASISEMYQNGPIDADFNEGIIQTDSTRSIDGEARHKKSILISREKGIFVDGIHMDRGGCNF